MRSVEGIGAESGAQGASWPHLRVQKPLKGVVLVGMARLPLLHQDVMMNTLVWLISKIVQFFSGGDDQRRSRSMTKEKEERVFKDETAGQPRNFDADYRAATKLLKTRMDQHFPDNYHARLSAGSNSTHDHGEDRATAVDTASTAIAMALRKGATVRQAAEAGAASIGI